MKALNRYLMVECEDKVVGKMYAKVAYHYFKAILEVTERISRYLVYSINTSKYRLLEVIKGEKS